MIKPKPFLLMLFVFLSYQLFGQNPGQAQELVEAGIYYHDQGDYAGAIVLYDNALVVDTNNLAALTEKAISLLVWNQCEASIALCQKAFASHANDKGLGLVYVAYGDACYKLKQIDKSFLIYEQGITAFPDFFQLPFHKGVALTDMHKYDEALLCFQRAAMLNPDFPGSQNALAQILVGHGKRIPALLAFCRFMVLEPKSLRAMDNLVCLQTIMNGKVVQPKKRGAAINHKHVVFGSTASNVVDNVNRFTDTDVVLSMEAVQDFDEKNADESDVAQFVRKIKSVCGSLKKTQKTNCGFYWDYYAPYFIELNDRNLVETLAYITFASSEDDKVLKWLDSHKKEVDTFYLWSKSFKWYGN